MISTNSLQKRMSSWWIEGKVSEEFQYLSQASWSKKNAVWHFSERQLDPNCMLLQVDFAMVNSCEYQNEIQVALWLGRYINVFTAATYNAERKAFMLEVVDELTFKDKRDFTVYSDGPSKQF